MRYSDPSGHYTEDEVTGYLQSQYPDAWEFYLHAWKHDAVFWEMLMTASNDDVLGAPTALHLTNGTFRADSSSGFRFDSTHELHDFQGYGPYRLIEGNLEKDKLDFANNFHTGYWGYLFSPSKSWTQPLYNYDGGRPILKGYHRRVTYSYSFGGFDIAAGDDIPFLIVAGSLVVGVACPKCAAAALVVDGVGLASGAGNVTKVHHMLTVEEVSNKHPISQIFTLLDIYTEQPIHKVTPLPSTP